MEPNPDRIHILTLKEIEGTLSAEEKKYLYEAITENAEAFRQWQSIHQVLGQQQLQEANESMQRHSVQATIAAANKRRRNFAIKTWFIAAAVLLLVCSSLYLFRVKLQPSNRYLMAAMPILDKKYLQLEKVGGKILNLPEKDSIIQTDGITFSCTGNTLQFTTQGQQPGLYKLNVPYGMNYRVILSDGTIVQLNAGTAITFPLQFTGRHREVAVNGEAFLTVAKKAQQPFRVYLPGSQVEVLGTSFNVNTYDSGVARISLDEGAVNVLRDKEILPLAPGYEAVSVPGKALAKQPFDRNTVLSWRKGKQEFSKDATLLDVCRALPRFYGIDVQLADTNKLKRSDPVMPLDRQVPLAAFLKILRRIDPTSHYDFDEQTKILKVQ